MRRFGCLFYRSSKTLGANEFLNRFQAPQARVLTLSLHFNGLLQLCNTIICRANNLLHLIMVCRLHLLHLLRQSLVLQIQGIDLIHQSFSFPSHISDLRLQLDYRAPFFIRKDLHRLLGRRRGRRSTSSDIWSRSISAPRCCSPTQTSWGTSVAMSPSASPWNAHRAHHRR